MLCDIVARLVGRAGSRLKGGGGFGGTLADRLSTKGGIALQVLGHDEQE